MAADLSWHGPTFLTSTLCSFPPPFLASTVQWIHREPPSHQNMFGLPSPTLDTSLAQSAFVSSYPGSSHAPASHVADISPSLMIVDWDAGFNFFSSQNYCGPTDYLILYVRHSSRCLTSITTAQRAPQDTTLAVSAL